MCCIIAPGCPVAVHPEFMGSVMVNWLDLMSEVDLESGVDPQSWVGLGQPNVKGRHRAGMSLGPPAHSNFQAGELSATPQTVGDPMISVQTTTGCYKTTHYTTAPLLVLYNIICVSLEVLNVTDLIQNAAKQ